MYALRHTSRDDYNHDTQTGIIDTNQDRQIRTAIESALSRHGQRSRLGKNATGQDASGATKAAALQRSAGENVARAESKVGKIARMNPQTLLLEIAIAALVLAGILKLVRRR